MDASPISHKDMEAFANLNLFKFHPWEVQVIERLDYVVREVWKTGKANNTPTPNLKTSTPEQIPVSNVAGIKALMLGLKSKHKDMHNKDT